MAVTRHCLATLICLPVDPEMQPGLAFLQRWERSAAAERANYQLFLSELCDFLEVPRPDPSGPDPGQNSYVFERAVTFHNGDGTTSTGRIDLYKRGCFVLEAKQGSHPLGSSSGSAPTSRGRQSRAGDNRLG